MQNQTQSPARDPHIDGAEVKAKSFDELRIQASQSCRRCGQAATHTLSLTAAVLGKGRGSMVATVPRVPVCEACGVEVFTVVKRALKQ